MSNAEWYYARDGQQLGPVSSEQLAALAESGELHPDDFVWTEGFPQWQPAGSVRHLFSPRGFGRSLDSRPRRRAGFWIRLAAFIIDALVLSIPNCVSYGLFFAIFGAMLGPTPSSNTPPSPAVVFGSIGLMLAYGVVWTCLSWLYFALMHSSSTQATVGKMAVGIIVTDMQGNRLTFARATGRHFATLVTGLIPLFIGYILAGVTERKQALHDMIAGTLVFYKR